MKNGRLCWLRRNGEPMLQAIIATRSQKNTVARGGTNLGMAIIREHLASKGLGLHNDLQKRAFHRG